MKNTIEADLKCSFKGEVYSLSVNFDLDQLMNQYGCLPSLHLILAQENQIDTYSYLYEMIETTPIYFHNAKGLASDFLHHNLLDVKGFEIAWRKQRLLYELQEISQQEMSIAHLEQHPALLNALERAYQLGVSDNFSSTPQQ